MISMHSWMIGRTVHHRPARSIKNVRVNEEAVRKERQAEKTAEEVLRLHAQLGLAQEKTAHTEVRAGGGLILASTWVSHV